MLRVLALVVLVSCAAKRPPESGAPAVKATATRPAPALDVATVVVSEVTGVSRGPATEFPAITYLASILRSPPPCWVKLHAAIEYAYQLQLPGTSYFVFEGTLPRDEVERCIPTALAGVIPLHVSRDGELVVFDAGAAGTIYAAWRGSMIVAGTKAQVTSALQANEPALARTWRERLAELPVGEMAIWNGDYLLTNLLEVPTTSYVFAFKGSGQGELRGRVIARYASPEDAAVAARRIRDGELNPDWLPPDQIVAAVKRLKVTQTGTAVEATFDSETFGELELAKMQAWLVQLQTLRAAGML